MMQKLCRALLIVAAAISMPADSKSARAPINGLYVCNKTNNVIHIVLGEQQRARGSSIPEKWSFHPAGSFMRVEPNICQIGVGKIKSWLRYHWFAYSVDLTWEGP